MAPRPCAHRVGVESRPSAPRNAVAVLAVVDLKPAARAVLLLNWPLGLACPVGSQIGCWVPAVSGLGALARVRLAAQQNVPGNKTKLKMLQTSKFDRKINMNQKNVNKIWKCSGEQTLPTGIIEQHNKNTFVWCFIKRTKMPFYGIFKLLQYIISKNCET